MLYKREISIGLLITTFGFILGFGLLASTSIPNMHDIGRWGTAVLMVTCTYTVHRSMAARDELLTAAYKLGLARGQERSGVSSIH